MFFDEILIVRLSYSLSSVITLENSFHREMFLSFASNIKRGVNILVHAPRIKKVAFSKDLFLITNSPNQAR
jgi:hypothetical protein